MATTINAGIAEALESGRGMVDRVAESVGVAAEAAAAGSLTPDQLRLIARGLRDVRDELFDVSEALRGLIAKAR